MNVHRGAVTEAAVAVNLVRAMPPTTVLILLNMVQEDELKDEEEYEVPFALIGLGCFDGGMNEICLKLLG